MILPFWFCPYIFALFSKIHSLVIWPTFYSCILPSSVSGPSKSSQFSQVYLMILILFSLFIEVVSVYALHTIFTLYSQISLFGLYNKIKPSRKKILSFSFLLGCLVRHWLEIFSCPHLSVLPAQLFLQWAVIWIRKPIQLKNNPAKRFIFILLLKLNPLLCLHNIYANKCPNAIESTQKSWLFTLFICNSILFF